MEGAEEEGEGTALLRAARERRTGIFHVSSCGGGVMYRGRVIVVTDTSGAVGDGVYVR